MARSARHTLVWGCRAQWLPKKKYNFFLVGKKSILFFCRYTFLLPVFVWISIQKKVYFFLPVYFFWAGRKSIFFFRWYTFFSPVYFFCAGIFFSVLVFLLHGLGGDSLLPRQARGSPMLPGASKNVQTRTCCQIDNQTQWKHGTPNWCSCDLCRELTPREWQGIYILRARAMQSRRVASHQSIAGCTPRAQA